MMWDILDPADIWIGTPVTVFLNNNKLPVAIEVFVGGVSRAVTAYSAALDSSTALYLMKQLAPQCLCPWR